MRMCSVRSLASRSSYASSRFLPAALAAYRARSTLRSWLSRAMSRIDVTTDVASGTSTHQRDGSGRATSSMVIATTGPTRASTEYR